MVKLFFLILIFSFEKIFFFIEAKETFISFLTLREKTKEYMRFLFIKTLTDVLRWPMWRRRRMPGRFQLHTSLIGQFNIKFNIKFSDWLV